jgi:hypothetical protein
LGLEDTSSTVGIHDHMKNINRENTIQIGVWKRSSGSIIVFGTYSVRERNYQHDKARHGIGKAKSADDHGRR